MKKNTNWKKLWKQFGEIFKFLQRDKFNKK
jgi:hypothetical protein